MSIRLHKKAVLDRLAAAARLTDRVYEGRVQSRTEAYAALYADSGFRPLDRLAGAHGGTVTYRYWFHSIGSTPDQAQWIAELVLNQLINWRVHVPGFTCTPMQHRSSQPVQMDPTAKPVLFYSVDEYAFTSNPT